MRQFKHRKFIFSFLVINIQVLDNEIKIFVILGLTFLDMTYRITILLLNNKIIYFCNLENNKIEKNNIYG